MPRLLRMPEVAAGAAEAVLAEWLVAETRRVRRRGHAGHGRDRQGHGRRRGGRRRRAADHAGGAGRARRGGRADCFARPARRGRCRTSARSWPTWAWPHPPGRGRRPRAAAAPQSLQPRQLCLVGRCGPVSRSPCAAAPAGAATAGVRQPAGPQDRPAVWVAVATITGTGPGGRILRRDVEAAVADARGRTTAPAAPPAAAPAAAARRPDAPTAATATSRTAASAGPLPPG